MERIPLTPTEERADVGDSAFQTAPEMKADEDETDVNSVVEGDEAMDILEVFVARPGELITRDEIIGKVWGNTLVEEGNLSVHISKLRKALGEFRGQNKLETVPGLGYRFTASVENSPNGHLQTPSAELIHTSNGNSFHGRNSEAIRLLEKGRLVLTNHTSQAVTQAIKFFERSLALDPGNLSSYWELLSALRFLHFIDHLTIEELLSRSEPLLGVMSELNGNADLTQLAHGEFELYLRWKFKKALSHFKQAVESNPQNVRAHCCLVHALIYTQRFSEAVQIIPTIAALEPFSIKISQQIARFHYQMGNFGSALSVLDEAVEIDPVNFETLLLRGTVLAEIPKLSDAADELKRSLSINQHLETISMLGYVYALQANEI